MTNVFYRSNINEIGGLETFFYEMGLKYDYDMVLIYDRIHPKQLERLEKVMPCIKYEDQHFKCDKLFICNNDVRILDTVEAKEVIQMIHGMFKSLGIEPNVDPRVTKRIAVSQAAADEYYELTGIMPEVVRNPLNKKELDDVLFLISATRLSSEKGGERMVKLANLLKKANKKFIWFILTNDIVYDFPENVYKIEPTLDIMPWLLTVKGKGYGVQLSDSEGDSYFTRECQSLGIPLLITPVKSFFEQDLEDGKNCYVLPFDMRNIDIEKICNKIPEVEPYIRGDNWSDYLVHNISTYKEDIKMKYKVEALSAFKEYDLRPKELDHVPVAGETFEVDKIRLDILLGNNSYNVAFVKVVEEEPTDEEVKEEPKKSRTRKK